VGVDALGRSNFFSYIYHSGLGLDLKVQKYLASHVWIKFYGEFRGIVSIQYMGYFQASLLTC
jgi:hypothetical protein